MLRLCSLLSAGNLHQLTKILLKDLKKEYTKTSSIRLWWDLKSFGRQNCGQTKFYGLFLELVRETPDKPSTPLLLWLKSCYSLIGVIFTLVLLWLNVLKVFSNMIFTIQLKMLYVFLITIADTLDLQMNKYRINNILVLV